MTGHLGDSHQKFFKHWDNLLSKEEKDVSKFRRELWGMLSSEREAVGRYITSFPNLPNGQPLIKTYLRVKDALANLVLYRVL